MGSTGARRGMIDGVWLKICQKLLNNDVIGCQGGGGGCRLGALVNEASLAARAIMLDVKLISFSM